MKKQKKFLIAILISCLCCSMAPVATKEILLWPNGVPGAVGKTGEEQITTEENGELDISNINNPSITPYLPSADKNTGVAIIIAPGGGHRILRITHQGYKVAQWFQAHGVAAFVLKYRLANQPNSTYTVEKDALADMQRAIRLVRSYAKEWHIDPAKVGIMGFSAGGELAALAGYKYNTADVNATDPTDRQNNKPDFDVLMYPVNISKFEVTKNSPPLFISVGEQDQAGIIEGVKQLALKYKQIGVPAESHIYPGIGHAFGISDNKEDAYSVWPEQVMHWLGDNGFLKNK